jgi:DNA-binding response OmpR family regulator
MLPDADGLQTISAVKADRPVTPVVAISGGGMFAISDLLAIARSVGADAAIAKPFRVAEIVGAVSNLLSPPLPELAA